MRRGRVMADVYYRPFAKARISYRKSFDPISLAVLKRSWRPWLVVRSLMRKHLRLSPCGHNRQTWSGPKEELLAFVSPPTGFNKSSHGKLPLSSRVDSVRISDRPSGNPELLGNLASELTERSYINFGYEGLANRT